jgi:hypothetical protein
MPQTSGDDSKIIGCKKVYTDATHSEELGHYFVRCIRDESVLDVPQTLSITINYQKSTKTDTFMTFIEVDRTWGK